MLDARIKTQEQNSFFYSTEAFSDRTVEFLLRSTVSNNPWCNIENEFLRSRCEREKTITTFNNSPTFFSFLIEWNQLWFNVHLPRESVWIKAAFNSMIHNREQSKAYKVRTLRPNIIKVIACVSFYRLLPINKTIDSFASPIPCNLQPD